eukprot:TRINITY_DN20940_c0_g1_i2.p1 TRINITY_DN20940_c0_g1~~TRINITY_DN20940_c0_g1_i2.p1  ORF type:complete len:299 (+),score=39.46 TRINITY_DN20940_c0_g1_i2:59-955(+)
MGCSRSRASTDDEPELLTLLDSPAASLTKRELNRLTRNDLRKHLTQLGAAQTECDGLSHAALVDRVLLWNAMIRVRGANRIYRAIALKALRDEGLGRDALERGLIVLGTSKHDRKSLTQNTAALMLHWTLVQGAMVASTRRVAPLCGPPTLRCIIAAWRRVSRSKRNRRVKEVYAADGADGANMAEEVWSHQSAPELLFPSVGHRPESDSEAGGQNEAVHDANCSRPTETNLKSARDKKFKRLDDSKSARDEKFERLDDYLAFCLHEAEGGGPDLQRYFAAKARPERKQVSRAQRKKT